MMGICDTLFFDFNQITSLFADFNRKSRKNEAKRKEEKEKEIDIKKLIISKYLPGKCPSQKPGPTILDRSLYPAVPYDDNLK